jgi:hypothetical protein
MANNGTFLPPISASPTRNHGLKTGMRSGVDASPTMAQRLVSDIIEIRANIDDIARRENKLRKAIQFFTVKRSGQDRCVSPRPLSRPYDGGRSNLPPNLPPTGHRQMAGCLSQA